jgi:hypothetical protein
MVDRRVGAHGLRKCTSASIKWRHTYVA